MLNGWQPLQIEMISKNSNIHPEAKIGNNVTIGNYCDIGPEVVIGDNCIIYSHVVISGNTIIGSNNSFFPFACIGTNPQDLKYNGEKNSIVIGNNNKIREYVTVNPGTAAGGGITKLGNNCLLMISSHIAHDCIIGDSVIIANNVPIAGHCQIDNEVIIGGNSAVQQFCSIGKGAMVGGMTGVNKSILPYTLATGNRCYYENLNLIGLKRKGFDNSTITDYKEVVETYFKDRNKIEDTKKSNNSLIKELHLFLEKNVNKQICTPLNQ